MAVTELTGCLVGLVGGIGSVFLGLHFFGWLGALLGFPIGYSLGAFLTGGLFTLSDAKATTHAEQERDDDAA